MLSHLSSKFAAPTESQQNEPRAALFLNRFTRTLTIMYATSGLSQLLGISGEELTGESFYYCIKENCLREAVRCLENAKSNDSIAYLRFWFRDPRQDNETLEQRWLDAQNELDGLPTTYDAGNSEDEDMGGVGIYDRRSNPSGLRHRAGLQRHSESSAESQAMTSESDVEPMDTSGQNLAVPLQDPQSRDSSGHSSGHSSGTSNVHTHEAVFGEPRPHESSESSTSNSPNNGSMRSRFPIELEAVVSCTSDGLVVCMRQAKGPPPVTAIQPTRRHYTDGLFAVPWATTPFLPRVPGIGAASSIDPLNIHPAYTQPWDVNPGRPPIGSDYLNTIRDIAVFAWALVGINGSLAEYSHGAPRGEAQPASGIPIWRPDPSDLRHPPLPDPPTRASRTSNNSSVSPMSGPPPAQPSTYNFSDSGGNNHMRGGSIGHPFSPSGGAATGPLTSMDSFPQTVSYGKPNPSYTGS